MSRKDELRIVRNFLRRRINQHADIVRLAPPCNYAAEVRSMLEVERRLYGMICSELELEGR